jgi:hypothetical protein
MLNVIQIIIILLSIPLMVKFFSEYIRKFLDVSERVSLVVGVLFTIPLAFLLYQNFWASLIAGIILLLLSPTYIKKLKEIKI